MNINLNKDYLLSFIIIILNIFIISSLKIGIGESLKSWIAAKIFIEDFKFLNGSFGPLYTLYLQLFSLFKFPYSLKIEAIVTTSIFSVTFYYLLKIKFKKILSFLLVISFLPFFINIQPKQNIMAASFFILYIIKIIKKKNEVLPIELLVCSLMGRTFFPLLILNFIFKIRDIKLKNIFNKKNAAKILLIILFIFSLTNQWKNKFNNHMIVDPEFIPDIDLNNPVEIGFFQFDNENRLKRNNLEKKDWYISFDYIYGKNNSLIKIILNEPKIFFEHLLNNIPKLGNSIGHQFLPGIFKKLDLISKIIFSFFISSLILSGLFFIFREFLNRNDFITITLFISLFISVLLVTNPTIRYLAIIFPFFLFLFLIFLNKLIKKKIYTFIIFYTIFVFYFNLKKAEEISTESIYFNNELISFIKRINDTEKEITIFTNEKNYLKIVLDKKITYIGFDSVPPYHDQMIFDYIKNVDYIIFTSNAKSYDDISTKQGDKYLHYVKPYIKSDEWKNIKIDDFVILVNKKKL